MRLSLICGAAVLSAAVLAFGACVHDRASLLVPCEAPDSACGGVCVDLQLDPDHCGACDNRCAAAQLCSVGACGDECQGGTEQCGNACVDVMSDAAHCGACDQPCDAGLDCVAGACGSGCAPPLVDCGGCVDTQLDAAHCGACQSACQAGEACVAGDCYAPDCATLLGNDNTLGDGSYMIDPDGLGGEAPFVVTCNMSIDGGGWIALMLNDSQQLLMAENAANNPWNKCADDAASHFDWIAEGAVMADFTGSMEVVVPLGFIDPTSMTPFSDAQLDALRAAVSELSLTTRMVAVTADDDNGAWQTNMVSGHEVYIMGAAMSWILLTPGEDGDCGGAAGGAGQSGFYLWHQSAAGSQVAGTTGLMDADLPGLGPGDILPRQVRLVVASGGGVAFGYEQQTLLVR